MLTAQAIDFDGEVNLFHFYLLRSVGKGAFGKVRVLAHVYAAESEREADGTGPSCPA
jgi:hypothetical protein